MKDYQDLSTPVLEEMLAKLTKDYTKMLFNNDRSEVFDSCENSIFLLQMEINSRISKKKDDDTGREESEGDE